MAPGTIFNNVVDVDIFKGFNFEGLPNRDSLKYIDLYGLNANRMQTMFRGTLRYKVIHFLILILIQLHSLSIADMKFT